MKRYTLIATLVVLVIATSVIAQNTARKPDNTGTKKVFYSYVVEAFSGKTSSFFASGNSISDKLGKDIKTAKYTQDALDYMGAEGWELVSVTSREFQTMLDGGLEVVYYFKK